MNLITNFPYPYTSIPEIVFFVVAVSKKKKKKKKKVVVMKTLRFNDRHHNFVMKLQEISKFINHQYW